MQLCCTLALLLNHVHANIWGYQSEAGREEQALMRNHRGAVC